MNFVIFDLETTGLSPNYHEIIQIAGVRVSSDPGRRAQAEEFSTYVRPTVGDSGNYFRDHGHP